MLRIIIVSISFVLLQTTGNIQNSKSLIKFGRSKYEYSLKDSIVFDIILSSISESNRPTFDTTTSETFTFQPIIYHSSNQRSLYPLSNLKLQIFDDGSHDIYKMPFELDPLLQSGHYVLEVRITSNNTDRQFVRNNVTIILTENKGRNFLRQTVTQPEIIWLESQKKFLKTNRSSIGIAVNFLLTDEKQDLTTIFEDVNVRDCEVKLCTDTELESYFDIQFSLNAYASLINVYQIPVVIRTVCYRVDFPVDGCTLQVNNQNIKYTFISHQSPKIPKRTNFEKQFSFFNWTKQPCKTSDDISQYLCACDKRRGICEINCQCDRDCRSVVDNQKSQINFNCNGIDKTNFEVKDIMKCSSPFILEQMKNLLFDSSHEDIIRKREIEERKRFLPNYIQSTFCIDVDNSEINGKCLISNGMANDVIEADDNRIPIIEFKPLFKTEVVDLPKYQKSSIGLKLNGELDIGQLLLVNFEKDYTINYDNCQMELDDWSFVKDGNNVKDTYYFPSNLKRVIKFEQLNYNITNDEHCNKITKNVLLQSMFNVNRTIANNILTEIYNLTLSQNDETTTRDIPIIIVSPICTTRINRITLKLIHRQIQSDQFTTILKNYIRLDRTQISENDHIIAAHLSFECQNNTSEFLEFNIKLENVTKNFYEINQKAKETENERLWHEAHGNIFLKLSVEYYEYAFKRTRASGNVITSKVYESGNHMLGPFHNFLKYKASSHNLNYGDSGREQVSIFTKNKQPVKLRVSFQYFLIKDDLHHLHQKYGQHYEDTIARNAREALKIAVTEFTSDEFIRNRTKIDNSLKNELVTRMSGKCCIPNCVTKRECAKCKNHEYCVEGCIPRTNNKCSPGHGEEKGFFIHVKYFQLHRIILPNKVIQIRLQGIIQNLQDEGEQSKQKLVKEQKETEEKVANILNQAKKLQRLTTSECDLLRRQASANSSVIVEKAKTEGVQNVFDSTGATSQKEKASFIYLNMLKSKSNIQYTFNYDTKVSINK
ncbi:hypothetical protein SNEBB_008864 [Seison nebaliae]|nr:hypothetical protein SNEBB_008864 [Seison nebaliae]